MEETTNDKIREARRIAGLSELEELRVEADKKKEKGTYPKKEGR